MDRSLSPWSSRYLTVGLLVLSAQIAGCEGEARNEAEKLYKDLEAHVVKAPGLKIKFSGSVSFSGRVDYRGLVILSNPNKLKLEVTEESSGTKKSWWKVSDGTIASSISADNPKIVQGPTEPNVASVSTLLFARLGAINIVGTHTEGARPWRSTEEIEKNVPIMRIGFVNEKAEPTDNIKVLEIEFDTRAMQKDSKAVVTLWVDTKRLLPTKRKVFLRMSDANSITEESYELVEIGEIKDQTIFQVPK